MIVLLALWLQDVDELIRKLGRDDIVERDEAARQLIEAGEPVRAKIEALLSSSDPEISGRAKAIQDALNERRILKAAFGEPRVYAIAARDEPLVDVLKKFRDDTKFPLVLQNVPIDARVTVDAKGATAFEVLERLCAASGKVGFSPGTQTISAAAPASYPSKFQDRWGLYLTGVTIHNSVSGAAGGYSYASAQVVGVWDTPKAPSSLRVDLTEVATDAGDNVARTEENNWGWNNRPPDAARAASQSASFNVPELTAKSLTFRGTAHFDYDIEEGLIVVENPVKGNDARQETDLGEFRLSEFSALDGFARVFVHFTSPSGAVGPNITRRRGITIRVVDEDGKQYHGNINSSSHGGGGITETWGYGADFELPSGKRVARVEVLFPKKSHTISVPFEFKDVPLP